jgi:hypothetical protein
MVNKQKKVSNKSVDKYVYNFLKDLMEASRSFGIIVNRSSLKV